MAGFSSLNTALSALRYHQVAMDVASNNIANSSTTGFVRRRVEAESLGAPTQAAMWSRYSGSGDGVGVAALTRLSDPYLDVRSRREHGKQSALDARVAVLDRVENGIGEPSDTGVAAALNDFRSAWHELVNHPEAGAARTLVLSAGASLADAINAQAHNLASELSDQRGAVVDLVSEVNTAASDMATINRSVVAAKASGTEHADLLDKRDQLALRLAELTGAVSTASASGSLDVTLGGISLVAGDQSARLSLVTDGSVIGQPLSFAVVSGTSSTPLLTAALGGKTGAIAELVSLTLPGYLGGLDSVAVQLADSVNALHATGYDASGNAGTPFFSYSADAGAARSLSVAVRDSGLVVASGTSGGGLDTDVADQLADLSLADASYEQLITSFGSTVASAKRLSDTQNLLTTQVDSSRQQLVGVSIDEESVNLLTAQRAYQAAARVMTTLDDVLDTLINRTGVTR